MASRKKNRRKGKTESEQRKQRVPLTGVNVNVVDKSLAARLKLRMHLADNW